ncbi:MAG: hypothetical protein ACRC7W_05715 [Fusobacteriaceae bacterium]
MKREDFREIKNCYLNTCNDLINSNGMCKTVICVDCPFSRTNSKYDEPCYAQYKIEGDARSRENIRVKLSKEFIRLFGDNESEASDNTDICKKPVSIDYEEKCNELYRKIEELKQENKCLRDTVKMLSKML